MNLQDTRFLTLDERRDLRLWTNYRKYAKKYDVHPMEYLKLLKGEVNPEDLMAITGIDDMVDDSARMQRELKGQKAEMERKIKAGKVPYQFDRLA